MAQGDVVSLFGPAFTAKVKTLPQGSWVGPVPSGYGFHLVRLESLESGHPVPFEVAREAVAREWSAAKRQEMKDAQLNALLARYKVTIEKAAPGETALVKP
jgi:parvulin-like peptidyl-prolyl isomerase